MKRLNILGIVILSNLLTLFVVFFLIPISFPNSLPQYNYSNTRIEQKNQNYSRLEDFGSDLSKNYEKIMNSYLVLEKNSTPIGGGIILTNDGYFLTAQHNLQISDLQVIGNGGKIFSIKNIRNHPNLDISIGKLVSNSGDVFNFQPANIVDANTNINIGQFVGVIGNPDQNFSPSMNIGIISQNFKIFSGQNYYLVDANIQKGNSGGPVFSTNGNIIGISSMEYDGGYILPINSSQIKNYLQMLQSGSILTPKYSFQIQRLNPILSANLGVEDQDGELVTSAGDGLLRGDIIYSVNNLNLENLTLEEALASSMVSSGVAKLEVLRNKQKQLITAPIGF